MGDALSFGFSTWAIPFFLDAFRRGRLRSAWGWAAGAFLSAAAGALLSPAPSDAAGLLAAWLSAAVAGPLVFRAARRRAERRFRRQLRRLRGPAREAAAEEDVQRESLRGIHQHLERLQDRFALLQAMATQLDTREILRRLGELWSGLPQVRRGVLFQRLPNGNWSPSFVHNVDKPETWTALMNNDDLGRSRRTRRFSSLDRHPALSAAGVQTPFLVTPFVWGDDVMALGALELAPSATEEAMEGFNVERKLVSIGLRRAFLYDLMSERGRHDGLTGAFLRRPFVEKLEESLRKRVRYGTAVALALVDVDRFKAVNDKFGHLAGDRALVHVAQTARRLAVPGVTLGRLGGDEFAFLLELPSFEESLSWLRRFHGEVRAGELKEGPTVFSVTVSVGAAEAPAEKTLAEDFLQRADQALYAAKKAGRDRVSVYEGPGPEGA